MRTLTARIAGVLVMALLVGACSRVAPVGIRATAGEDQGETNAQERVLLPSFEATVVVSEGRQEEASSRWQLRYIDEHHWTLTEAREILPTGLRPSYFVKEMNGDHYVETLHGIVDFSGVPRDVYDQYAPTFVQLPVEKQHELTLEGLRRGWVKLVSRTESEATGTAPVPPTPLFEIVTPYPWNFGGTPSLTRNETTRADGSRVVTLTGRLTCLEARVEPDLCGGSLSDFETLRKPVVRTYELRADGIPVRFVETFGGTVTKVISLDDIVLS